MRKPEENHLLASMLRNISKAEKPFTTVNLVISAANIIIFGVIAYLYLSASNGHLSLNVAIIACVALGVISDAITMYKYTKKYSRYSALYINKEKVEKRQNEINT